MSTRTRHSNPGRLLYCPETRRYVLFGHEFHCGDCLQVLAPSGKWVDTRMEHDKEGWYLVGVGRLFKEDNYVGRLYL